MKGKAIISTKIPYLVYSDLDLVSVDVWFSQVDKDEPKQNKPKLNKIEPSQVCKYPTGT